MKRILLLSVMCIAMLPKPSKAQYNVLTHDMDVIDDEPYLNKAYLNLGIVGLSHLNPFFVDVQMRNYIKHAKWQIDSRFAYGLASLGSNEQGQNILHPKESLVNPTELEIVATYNFRRIDDTKKRKIYIGSSGSGNNITRYFSRFDVHHISTFGARFGMLHRKNHLEGLRYEAGSFPAILIDPGTDVDLSPDNNFAATHPSMQLNQVYSTTNYYNSIAVFGISKTTALNFKLTNWHSLRGVKDKKMRSNFTYYCDILVALSNRMSQVQLGNEPTLYNLITNPKTKITSPIGFRVGYLNRPVKSLKSTLAFETGYMPGYKFRTGGLLTSFYISGKWSIGITSKKFGQVNTSDFDKFKKD